MKLAWRDLAGVLAPVLLSALATLLIVRLSRDAGRPALAAERRPLRFSDAAAACESCHPRHTSEWRRSVMAHASTSPLFQSLELLIQEQVGKSADCPSGAGVLRRRDPASDCRDPATGRSLTGSGGEGWCVNCHAPGQNLGARSPAWDARSPFGRDNRPLGELLGPAGHDGIGCTFCHQVASPSAPSARGERGERGNARWLSVVTGESFEFRSDARERRLGIGNSGYALDPRVLLATGGAELVPGGAHRRMSDETRAYLRSSEFCGTCHDVRLFGTDVLGAARGEHFKRLRNAYSEWTEFARAEERLGRVAPSCQDCHLSSFPGVCVPDASNAGGSRGCPPGTRFEARAPGDLPRGFAAAAATRERELHPHYLSGIELPFAREFERALATETALDPAGIPLGGRVRRDQLLARSARIEVGALTRRAGGVEIPITVENVGAGHRVPAGFSQERELWVHLEVKDARGRTLYEAGRVDRADQDLQDKRFLRVNVDDGLLDAAGRPQGLFGADVADGPDAPRWEPPPDLGGTQFRGRGLVSFQNGFLRCVRCIGRIDAAGRCQPLPGQEGSRAARFADGDYDPDTGACVSNLAGRAALFETYFPVGALDASRGVTKAPDAIIDARSLPPKTPVTYVYVLDGAPSERLQVRARLLFRAYPPYLLRAFAAYEARMSARGLRGRGPLVGAEVLDQLEIVEVARAERHGG